MARNRYSPEKQHWQHAPLPRNAPNQAARLPTTSTPRVSLTYVNFLNPPRGWAIVLGDPRTARLLRELLSNDGTTHHQSGVTTMKSAVTFSLQNHLMQAGTFTATALPCGIHEQMAVPIAIFRRHLFNVVSWNQRATKLIRQTDLLKLWLPPDTGFALAYSTRPVTNPYLRIKRGYRQL